MELITTFKNDLALRRRSKGTISNYIVTIRAFLRHNPDPNKVTHEDLEIYLQTLLENGAKTNTLKFHFAALSSFYEFLVYKQIADRNPILGFRKRYIGAFNDSERRRIISVREASILISTIQHIREMAIVMTLAKTGIRRMELLSMKPGDIDLQNNRFVIKRQKKAQNLIRFIDPELKRILKKYMKWRDSRIVKGYCNSEYLWISDTGGRVHKDYLNQFIQAYAEPLGLHDPDGTLETRLTCHCFRGFIVTHLRRAGMKKEHIQTLLGHSLNKEVWSGHYLEIDMELVREDYLKCVPKLL